MDLSVGYLELSNFKILRSQNHHEIVIFDAVTAVKMSYWVHLDVRINSGWNEDYVMYFCKKMYNDIV